MFCAVLSSDSLDRLPLFKEVVNNFFKKISILIKTRLNLFQRVGFSDLSSVYPAPDLLPIPSSTEILTQKPILLSDTGIQICWEYSRCRIAYSPGQEISDLLSKPSSPDLLFRKFIYIRNKSQQISGQEFSLGSASALSAA